MPWHCRSRRTQNQKHPSQSLHSVLYSLHSVQSPQSALCTLESWCSLALYTLQSWCSLVLECRAQSEECAGCVYCTLQSSLRSVQFAVCSLGAVLRFAVCALRALFRLRSVLCATLCAALYTPYHSALHSAVNIVTIFLVLVLAPFCVLVFGFWLLVWFFFLYMYGLWYVP